MINQAVMTLSELPRFTAYAKTITQQAGEETVWKGKIKTAPIPEWSNEPDIEERIIELTRTACCRPRDEIQQEISERRARWRSSPGGDDEPPPSWSRG